MATFLQAYEEAEAAGVLHGAETLPTGDYTVQLASIKAGTTKKGAPSLSVLVKTTDGRTAFMNLNYIPDNQVGNALTIQMLQDLGITRDFLSRVDTTQGLEPFVPELLRVSTGRWYEMSVTTKPGTGEWAGKMNSNFKVRANNSSTGALQSAVQGGPQFQASPAVQPAPAPAVQPVAVPVAQAPIPQPAQQGVPIPQPSGIPQPVQVDPATGLPPRPGI